jgi:hypothetical protein
MPREARLQLTNQQGETMHYTGFSVAKIAARLMRLSEESNDFFDGVYLLEAARLLVEQHDALAEGANYGN